jgi:hypothetical protein
MVKKLLILAGLFPYVFETLRNSSSILAGCEKETRYTANRFASLAVISIQSFGLEVVLILRIIFLFSLCPLCLCVYFFS